METALFRALEAQRPAIRTHWESLLRLEPVSSPLAQPDLLLRLLDHTLDEIFALLSIGSVRRHPTRTPPPECACGRNPLLAYYTAGHQALREALILTQASTPDLTSAQRDDTFSYLNQVFRFIARREIEAFCALCQFRSAAETSTRIGSEAARELRRFKVISDHPVGRENQTCAPSPNDRTDIHTDTAPTDERRELFRSAVTGK